MFAVLKFIFIFFLVMYILGFIGRISLRYWLTKKQREFQKNGGAYYKQYTWGSNPPRTEKQEEEGKIKVSADAAKHKTINKEVGDYVDYEEIK